LPIRPELAGRNPKGLIEWAESRFWMLAFGHDKLLPEGQVFEQEAFGATESNEEVSSERVRWRVT
jgi:hypothetical protein